MHWPQNEQKKPRKEITENSSWGNQTKKRA